MPALRCSICALDWPVEEEYELCPSCGGSTSSITNIRAMAEDEAASAAAHFRFESFYEGWDESRPAERLSTDGLREYEPDSEPGTSLAVRRVA